MSCEAALEAAGVRKTYASTVALDGVDLRVGAGEIVGLLGPNGAGKTTLASIVAGLIRPDEGAVAVGGVDVLVHPHRARSFTGFAPQATGVYETLTVEENLLFFGELVGLRRGELRRRVSEVCASLLLDDLRVRPCQRLSGGEKRRVHTAIALMGRPRLLLLDEPTVGADIVTRLALLDLVRELAAQGTAVVYSTHYLPEIETLGASAVLLDHGRVIARGNVQELVAAHGAAAVELSFEGPAPEVHLDGLAVVHDGHGVRIATPTPAVTAVKVLNALGADASRVRSLDLLQPSLESVFLSLTGRHYDAEDSPHVASS